MDIHDWLQNTADRQPPDEEEHPGFPGFFKPQRPPEPTRREQNRKRKRHLSEQPSSERHHHRRKRHQAATCSSSSSDHARQLQPAAASSRSSSYTSQSRHASDAARKEPPGKSFERRTRHKTKPDRYDAKPKKPTKDRPSKDDRKSKSKRRKSHQSADVARASGMIQSFQLKNGRRDKRLTLRPDVSAGIFKHGRSSAPVATNGPGLPDLVFNEMKFLQRPKEHQDEAHLDEAAKKRAKKSKPQLREEEISTYFAKKPGADGEHDHEAQRIPVTQMPNHLTNRSREQHRRPLKDIDVGRDRPSVDLPENSFLGFGSKGPSHESNVHHPEGTAHHPTSYFTWSESAVAQQRPRQMKQSRYDRQDGLLSVSSQVRDNNIAQQRLPTAKPDGRHHTKHPEQGNVSDAGSGEWVETRRRKGQPRVETYEPRKHARHTTKSEAKHVATRLSSESLPKPAETHSPEPDSHEQTHDFRTFDVLEIRDNQRHPLSLEPRQQPLDDKENGSRSTTPTSDLLRRALHAVTNVTNEESKEKRPLKTPWRREKEDGHVAKRVNILDTGYRPASHARRSNSVSTGMTPSQQLPQRGFSRSIDASRTQNRRPLEPISASDEKRGPKWRSPSNRDVNHGQEYFTPQVRIPDIPPNITPIPPYNHPTYHDSREAEGLVRRLMSEQERSFMNPPIEENAMLYDRYEMHFGHEAIDEVPNNSLYDAGFSHPSTDQPSIQMHTSEKQSNDQGGDDQMNGFWRPNILY